MIIFLPWHKQNSVLFSEISVHSLDSYWAFSMYCAKLTYGRMVFKRHSKVRQELVNLLFQKNNQQFVKRGSLNAGNSGEIGLFKMCNCLPLLWLQRQQAEEWANCREKSIICKMSRSAALHDGIALTPPLTRCHVRPLISLSNSVLLSS